MANRFWVGDSGSWSDNTNHWSASDGGAPNASKPTSADNVFFTANSFTVGGRTVTVDETSSCKDMDWTGATNTPTLNVPTNLLLTSGDTTFIAAMATSGANLFYFNGAGAQSLTTNGLTLTYHIVRATTGTATFLDGVSARAISIETGTLDTNGQTIILTHEMLMGGGGGVKTLTLGASTINCTSWNYSGSNLTLNENTSTIKVTGTGVFAGGDETYNDVELNGTAHTVSGDNTFNSLKLGSAVITCTSWNHTITTLDAGTSTIKVSGTGAFAGGDFTYHVVELNGTAHTISGDNTISILKVGRAAAVTLTFTDTKTQKVGALISKGSNVITMQGTGAGGWYLVKGGSGYCQLDFLDITNSKASPKVWYAGKHSTDSGGNTGWDFRNRDIAIRKRSPISL